MRKECLDSVFRLAKKNKKIVFIGSDLGAGVLNDFKKKIPERFFMEGISEQHIIGMAAGMAKEGFIPYVNTIATFITRRCFEQIAIDLCLHNLPVRLIGNGGGVVYAPLGPTHQAIEDIAIMRLLPNMSVFAVSDKVEMKKLMDASVNWPYPMYIRLGRGGDEIISKKQKFQIGKNITYFKPKKITIVSTGVTTQECIKVIKSLKKRGIECGLIHVHTIKPFDKKKFIKDISQSKYIFTVEEHLSNGGLGGIVSEVISENEFNINKQIIRIGIEDKFVNRYGSQQELFSYLKINAKNIEKAILKKISNK
jgi:transketolase|tara:strand:- start:85 stop:1011 length:927 start_codon:yes stop_codon:yes gene_type:complete